MTEQWTTEFETSFPRFCVLGHEREGSGYMATGWTAERGRGTCPGMSKNGRELEGGINFLEFKPG